MTKRKIKKAAYQAVVKEGKTHQDTFDELRKSSEIGQDALADEVSKIPSFNKNNSQQFLRYIFVGILCLVIIMRTLAIVGLSLESNINSNIIIFAILIGVLIPVYGIVGALTSRVDAYRTVGILFILSIFRSFTKGEMSSDPLNYLALIPFVAAIVLAFYIPTKLKTNYKKQVDKKEEDGKVITSYQYVFESNGISSNNELLDN